jgi:hypothetical protein
MFYTEKNKHLKKGKNWKDIGLKGVKTESHEKS